MEQIILGIIQGIAEWLPVSSEGMIVLTKTTLFHSQASLEEMVSEILFLHLGSVLAAAIYFRTDIARLFVSLKNISDKNDPVRPLLLFLVITTLLSGILGILLLKTTAGCIAQWPNSTRNMMLIVGIFLIITGVLQLIKKTLGTRITKDLTIIDGILLGIAQGFAALPGLSRSGLTVSVLLFRKFGAPQAIRLSFLMSIPIVLAGNVVMNLGGIGAGNFKIEQLAGLAVSFMFSLLTINILLKIARKINFGSFVLGVGILIILSAIFSH